jgi:Arc/MetJ family transcription regulator
MEHYKQDCVKRKVRKDERYMSNLSVDTQLLNDALKIGGLKTKKDTVNLALREFIKKRQMSEILELFGTIEYDEDYDYKEARRREK